MRGSQHAGQAGDNGDQCVAFGADAEYIFDLAGSDQDSRGDDETGDDRMAQQVADRPGANQRQHHQHRAAKKCQQDRRFIKRRRARHGHMARSGSGHQGRHRYRPDRERATRAKQRIGNQREDAGI